MKIISYIYRKKGKFSAYYSEAFFPFYNFFFYTQLFLLLKDFYIVHDQYYCFFFFFRKTLVKT